MGGNCKDHPGCDCVCDVHGKWDGATKTQQVVGWIVVPIAIAVIAFAAMMGMEVSMVFSPYQQFLEVCIATTYLVGIVFGAIPLSILLCSRDKCLESKEKFKAWNEGMTYTAWYLSLFIASWLGFFVISSYLVAALFALAALVIAAFRIGRCYFRIRNNWARVMYVLSLICAGTVATFCFASFGSPAVL